MTVKLNNYKFCWEIESDREKNKDGKNRINVIQPISLRPQYKVLINDYIIAI